MSNDGLIDAVHGLRLAEEAAQTSGVVADAALAACVAIEQRTVEAESQIDAVAATAGIQVQIEPTEHPRQNHAITVRVDSFHAADDLADALAVHGFERWERWTGGARESFARTATMMTVAATTDVTVVVRLRWADPVRRTIWQRAVIPTSGDWHIVDLPSWVWPAYSLIRPIRQLAEHVGLRRRHHASLGPYLTTPDALLRPLFDFAEITAADTLVDLGCGDGRIAIAAAEQTGCRALGVESDPELARRAAAQASASSAKQLIEVRHDDAMDVDLGDVTVAFVFLPVDVVADILPRILDKLPSGARLIVHEQSRLPEALEPDVSELVVSAEGVTVAHRWTIR